MAGASSRRRPVWWCSLVLPLLAYTGPAGAVLDIQHWTHDSGARVYFVSTSELAIVDIAMSFAAGSARDGERHGIASLLARLLDDGADGRDADSIADTFAQHAASFAATVDRDRLTVEMRSLSEAEHLQAALLQLAAVLQRPDFPPQAVARELARAQTELQARQQSPGEIAMEKLYASIYRQQPYAHPVPGTPETVAAIKRGDLQQFHRDHMTAANASVAIVGDVSRARAVEIVRMLLAGLPPGSRAAPLQTEAVPASEAVSQHHPFPSTQSHILLGHVGVAVADSDRIALYVGNHILGAGMVSRLFRSIREERGLAYSVYSYFLPLQAAGPFIVGMQTEVSQAEESVGLLLRQLQQYVRDGPTEQELEDAKSYISGDFPNRISSNAKLAGYLSWMAFYDLPPDYLRQFVSRVRAVSVEQIRHSLQKHLRVHELHEVRVGGES